MHEMRSSRQHLASGPRLAFPMRLRFFVLTLRPRSSSSATAVSARQAEMPAADSTALDFKQWGLLAIQDAGPAQTARYLRAGSVDQDHRALQLHRTRRQEMGSKRFRSLGAARDARLEERADGPGFARKLIEQLGLDKTKRRFSFAQLTASPELQRLAGEAHDLKRAEKPLNRVQQEVMNVSERLTLLTRIMDGSAFLIVPAAQKVTDPWVVPPGIRRSLQRATVRARADSASSLCDGLRAGGWLSIHDGGAAATGSAAQPKPATFIPPSRSCGWNISTIISKAFTVRPGVTVWRSCS